MKRNIHIVNKDSLAQLHVLLGRWRSHQICFCVCTIGNYSRRGCLGTTATVLPFLREKSVNGEVLLFFPKFSCFFSFLFRISPAFSLFFSSSMVIFFTSTFLCPPFLLCPPPATNGEVAIILILHMDITDCTPKPFSVFHVYL